VALLCQGMMTFTDPLLCRPILWRRSLITFGLL